MSRQLLRVCRSIPLSRLRQGGTLSIQSTFPNSRVEIRPEWRDDGHVLLEQWLPVSHAEAEMAVSQEQDTMTSLGRTETSFSIDIRPPAPANVVKEDAVAHVGHGSIANTTKDQETKSKVMIDDGTVLPDSEKWHGSSYRRVDYSDGITNVIAKDADERPQEPSLTLTATVPEKVNLSCNLNEGGTVSVANKIEGDVQLHTSDGDIRVKKLRGHHLELSADKCTNTVYASDLLEAESLKISTPGRVRCKRLHGTSIAVRVDRPEGADNNDSVAPATEDQDDEGSLIDISSLYVTRNGGAELYVSSTEPLQQRAVRVKYNHGHVSVDTNAHYPSGAPDDRDALVELGGVNGSYDISIRSIADKVVHSDDISEPFTARVHVDRLSPDSVSVAALEKGNVSLSLDRKLEADLRMLSCSTFDSLEECASLLEEDDPTILAQGLQSLDDASDMTLDMDEISVETDAFTRLPSHQSFNAITYVDGWVENRSGEPDSRFDVKTKGGKISLDGAASQALKGFAGHQGDDNGSRPLLVLLTSGKILMESLTWMGAIARRYGLEKDG